VKAILAVALFFVVPSIRIAAQTAPETKPCASSPIWLSPVRKPEEGWTIGFVDKARMLYPETPMASLYPALKGVFQSEYAVKERHFTYVEAYVDPCDHSAYLRTRYLHVEHVYAFVKNGKIFAYGMYGGCESWFKGELMPDACVMSILLTDTTGSGKFDSLRAGRDNPDTIPAWVGK
jgi:hypothetical protein